MGRGLLIAAVRYGAAMERRPPWSNQKCVGCVVWRVETESQDVTESRECVEE